MSSIGFVTKPLIALAGRIGPAGRVARVPVIFGGRRYFDAVLRAGGLPAMLTPQPLSDGDAKDLLSHFDGFVLMGGPDVDPSLFGQEQHPNVYGVNRENDDFEISLVRAAIDLDMPTLAVCRGMQVANVALGGTLVQHLDDHGLMDGHAPEGFPSAPEGVLHEVLVEEGSRLAKALGTDRPHGASYHHQALDRLGDGLIVTGRAEDGMVESVERDEGWFVAIQWHPEDTAHRDPQQQGLFDALVAQAQARRAIGQAS